MRIVASFALGFLTYLVMTWVLFGGPLHAFFFLLVIPDRLDLPGWPLFTITVIFALGWIIYGPANQHVRRPFRLPVFVAAAVLIPTSCIVLISDLKRKQAIEAFGADYVVENSLLKSLSRAPADFQFYLHAAALKDCEPYAWSYRTMEFYPLSRRVASNVIPNAWSSMCGITID